MQQPIPQIEVIPFNPPDRHNIGEADYHAKSKAPLIGQFRNRFFGLVDNGEGLPDLDRLQVSAGALVFQ